MTRMRIALALAAAVIAGCGAPPSPGSGAVATTAPAATAPPAAASPTPRPSPMVSAKGLIAVNEPVAGQTIRGGVLVSGDASVFEANVQYRVVTAAGSVIAQGHTTASAAGPQRGTFRIEVKFDVPYSTEQGFVEVFETSARDGTISDIVRVPVTIAGAY
jgi:hypothetical protein